MYFVENIVGHVGIFSFQRIRIRYRESVWKIRQRRTYGCERLLRRRLNRFDVRLRHFLDRIFPHECVLKVNLNDHTFRFLPFVGQETVAFDGLAIDLVAFIDRRIEGIVREQIRPNLKRCQTSMFVSLTSPSCTRYLFSYGGFATAHVDSMVDLFLVNG